MGRAKILVGASSTPLQVSVNWSCDTGVSDEEFRYGLSQLGKEQEDHETGKQQTVLAYPHLSSCRCPDSNAEWDTLPVL